MRVRLEEILARLDETQAFCRDLGLGHLLEPGKGRFGEYRRLLVHLVDSVRRADGDTQELARLLAPNAPLYRLVLAESSEFGGLLPYLTSCDRDEVREKLRDVLDGAVWPRDEKDASSSNRARNVQFELFLGSCLSGAGFAPVLGKWPDLKCEVDGVEVHFECKRLFSRERLKARLKDAANQLVTVRKKSLRHSAGVIAISLSRILNPRDAEIRYRDSAAGLRGLGQWLESIAEPVRSDCDDLFYRKGVDGILFHAGGSFSNLETEKYDIGSSFFGYGKGGRSAHVEAVDRIAAGLKKVADAITAASSG